MSCAAADHNHQLAHSCGAELIKKWPIAADVQKHLNNSGELFPSQFWQAMAYLLELPACVNHHLLQSLCDVPGTD